MGHQSNNGFLILYLKAKHNIEKTNSSGKKMKRPLHESYISREIAILSISYFLEKCLLFPLCKLFDLKVIIKLAKSTLLTESAP